MKEVKYLDKDKNFIKDALVDVVQDLHSVSCLCMCFEKDGVYNFITQEGVTDHELIKLKAHQEEYNTKRMIKANRVTPDDDEKENVIKNVVVVYIKMR